MSDPTEYSRPAHLKPISLERHAVIEASAGTGKTRAIQDLVVDLLVNTRSPVRLEQILVVTFTDKATLELRKKVRERISEIQVQERAWLAAFERGKGKKRAATLDIGEVRSRKRIRQLGVALRTFDDATICTIHAFCQRVLSENAFAHGRLFGEARVDSGEAFARAFKEALRTDLCRDEEERSFLREAIGELGGVPGLHNLLFKLARQRGPILPAFSLPALDAALAAFPLPLATAPDLERLLGNAGVKPSRTLTSVMVRIHRVADAIASWRKDGDRARALVAVAAGDLPLDWILQRVPEKCGVPKMELLREGVARLQGAAPCLQAAVAQRFLPPVLQRLRTRKREAGLYDYDDMLTVVRDGLKGVHGPALIAELRRKYRFALIDEFQDTDEVQWEIFRTLFADGGSPSRLVVVGDPKQAIYSFRGADVQTYERARDELMRGGGDSATLDENWRSTANLIAAYNTVIGSGDDQLFTGSIRYTHPVRCGNPRLGARDCEGQELVPVQLFGFDRGVINAGTLRRRLGSRIAREISELLAAPPSVVRKEGNVSPLEARDIFILTRTNVEGRHVGAALRRAGVPHAFYKQDGLFQTREAASIRDLLAAIDDPQSRSKRLQAWLTPFFAIPLEQLEHCTDVAADHPLMRRLFDWRALAERRDFERLFPRILQDSGVLRREVFLKGGERELTNFLHLFELLLDEASRTRCTLRELNVSLSRFIGQRSLPAQDDGNLQRLESDRNAVQIMTLHMCKGLEAEVVFLAGGFSERGSDGFGIFHSGGQRVAYLGKPPPLIESKIEREQIEEAQRLLYVGLTRAKVRLYLPYFREKKKDTKGGFDLDGPYQHLNARLAAVMGRGLDPALFQLEEVGFEPGEELVERADLEALAGWTPPAQHVAVKDLSAEMTKLAEERAGFIVTSYSKLHAADGFQSPWDSREESEGEPPAPPVERPEHELPGGAATGVFLHAALEELALETLRGDPPWDRWSQLPEVSGLFARLMRQHQIDPKFGVHAQQLVYLSLTTPLVLPTGATLKGLGHAARVLREMEFVYPIPERHHPRLSQPLGGELTIERGFIKGFVDFIFEHEGKVFLLDWKSDSLPAYDAASLTAHVDRNYQLQARFYSLALVKLLEIHSREEYEARFGGTVYCFLRAMGGGEGIATGRATWEEMLAVEEALITRQDWGERRRT